MWEMQTYHQAQLLFQDIIIVDANITKLCKVLQRSEDASKHSSGEWGTGKLVSCDLDCQLPLEMCKCVCYIDLNVIVESLNATKQLT